MNKTRHLKRQLASGTLSRREFIERAAALGVAAAAASSLWSGAAHAAQKGGRLRVGMAHGSTTDSLDPATFENGYTSTLNYTVNNHLAEIGTSGKLEPELAESWEASPDAREWTFKIRKGVEFHNGKTLDADDVVASVNHHRHEDSKSAAKALLKTMVDIKAQGKDTVKVTLDGGNAGFPYIISDYHVAILPSKDGKIDPLGGVGCGGYSVQAFEPGVRFLGKKHPNYWKSGHAHFDEVEILSIVDVFDPHQCPEDGRSRCDRPLRSQDRASLRAYARHQGRRDDGHRALYDSDAYRHVALRQQPRPHGSEAGPGPGSLVEDGAARPRCVGNDHPISPANQFHASELPQRTYDPDRARWHVKQAGLSSLSVDLSAADAAFAGAVDAAVLYKEHAAVAGIEINVIREPNDGYWSAVWMKKGWCMCYWGGRPTEDWMFSTAYSDSAAWNDTFWKHDRFNQLLIGARAELNDELRREMYVEMQSIVRDEGGVVVPLFNNYVFATSDKIAHGKMQGNWDLDGQKLAERWWFA